jgi:hypothetical protein
MEKRFNLVIRKDSALNLTKAYVHYTFHVPQRVIISVGSDSPRGSKSNHFTTEINPATGVKNHSRNSSSTNKNILGLESNTKKDLSKPIKKIIITTKPYLLKLISDEFGGSMEYAQLWLDSPNPAFGGKTPSYYLEKGRIDVVRDLIEAISSGQPY